VISGGTRPPERTAGWVGRLLGGLDIETRSHVTIRNWMVFHLDGRPAKEGEWDRDAILYVDSGPVGISSRDDGRARERSLADSDRTPRRTSLLLQRLRHIYIDGITGEIRTDRRYRETFENVPTERWTLFTDSAALLNVVFNAGRYRTGPSPPRGC
jgi:hypothetical protein